MYMYIIMPQELVSVKYQFSPNLDGFPDILN